MIEFDKMTLEKQNNLVENLLKKEFNAQKFQQKYSNLTSHLMELTDQQIQDNIVKIVEIQTQQVRKKSSFCRYFLRGLCLYDENNCSFSHGVHDLDYAHWTPDEVIQYDYLKETDFCQKGAIKGPRVYKDLYQFQKQKIFTLAELNQDRAKRVIIRQQLHKKMFNDFMKLLEQKYPGAQFTEQFLIRQYTRVGFNKLMTKIKFSHLTTYLCNDADSEFFQFSVVMPPHVKHQRVYVVRKANDEIVDSFYKSSYFEILKNHSQETIDQGKIKKMLFNSVRQSINIPPLNIHLKNKKLAFAIYLRSILGQKIVDLQIKFEADLPTLVQSSKKFLQQELPIRLVEWNDVYKYLAKQHQLNNGNIINQVKPFLGLQGFRFLFFPMTQFIVHPKIPSKIEFENHQQCPCHFKKQFQPEELSILNQSIQNQQLFSLQHKQSYDIFDLQSLIKCAPSIYNSKILGVDIQGRLRKNGYIQMIQLNNGQNTFLIDIYRMDLNGDVQTFDLTKKLLRNVLANPKIPKIFHDCRHDSLALHQFMQCCVQNIYDTSATQTYKGQIDLYKKLDEIISEQLDQNEKNYEKKKKQRQQKAKEIISQVNNVKTPGLNEILKTYNAPHGINKNKQLFHSMWNKGQTSLFDQRPLNPDFRQYCIKDVLDLPFVYHQMINLSKETQFDLDLAKWISSQYVKYGYLNTQEGEKQVEKK